MTMSNIGLRVETGFDAEHHRFGAGDIVDRDQEIGDVFHPAAVTEGAEIVRAARKSCKQRAQLADRLLSPLA